MKKMMAPARAAWEAPLLHRGALGRPPKPPHAGCALQAASEVVLALRVTPEEHVTAAIADRLARYVQARCPAVAERRAKFSLHRTPQ